jgi:hypothetical protein
MRNRNEPYIGGAQKGTRVRWAKFRRAGSGTVTEVHGVKAEDVEAGRRHYGEKEWTIKDDATGDLIECNINQIRFLNTPNRVKKQRYATKMGL